MKVALVYIHPSHLISTYDDENVTSCSLADVFLQTLGAHLPKYKALYLRGLLSSNIILTAPIRKYVFRTRKQLLSRYKLTSNGCNVNACAFVSSKTMFCLC
jgi:hypothetical protein